MRLHILAFLLLILYRGEIDIHNSNVDYHIVYDVEREYMGYKHVSKWEIWLSKDSVYFKSSKSTQIYYSNFDSRFELYRDKTYYKDENLNSIKTDIDSTINFSTLGYEKYRPKYDWVTTEKEAITKYGTEYIAFESNGEADFGSILSNYTLTKSKNEQVSKVLNKLLINIFKEMNNMEAIRNIMKKHPNFIPVEIEEKIIQPIAPDITYNYKLSLFKEEKSPLNIYSVPEGFKLMN